MKPGKTKYNPEQFKFYTLLNDENRGIVDELCRLYRFTFQETRFIVTAARDIELLKHGLLKKFYSKLHEYISKKHTFTALRTMHNEVLNPPKDTDTDLRSTEILYDQQPADTEFSEEPDQSICVQKNDALENNTSISGFCPVMSEKTMCCRLRTIDAVTSCSAGCQYCIIQTFYNGTVQLRADLPKALDTIPIDPSKRFHFGTGQSSDSLLWGNHHGMLDELCRFASTNKNIFLEFKTKSAKTGYFLSADPPKNIVISWSLNTEEAAQKYEKKSATIAQRIAAAAGCAGRGILVGFHFHPMIYDGFLCLQEYRNIASALMRAINPDRIAFISFGSLTLIKPVITSIRQSGNGAELLKYLTARDPLGKITYPDDIKIKIFSELYDRFAEWHNKVYMYLCMEKKEIWQRVFGCCYERNEDFEKALIDAVFEKITLVGKL